jgi:hypothetical protein
VLASSNALRLRAGVQLSIIAAVALLSPALVLLAAIAVEIVIGVLVDAGSGGRRSSPTARLGLRRDRLVAAAEAVAPPRGRSGRDVSTCAAGRAGQKPAMLHTRC